MGKERRKKYRVSICFLLCFWETELKSGQGEENTQGLRLRRTQKMTFSHLVWHPDWTFVAEKT
jgi:hypothetical protein